MARGSPDPSGFFIEYAARDIHGRITITARRLEGLLFLIRERERESRQPFLTGVNLVSIIFKRRSVRLNLRRMAGHDRRGTPEDAARYTG